MAEPADDVALDADSMYHLATAATWSGYQAVGLIEPSSLGAEGFVHCSWGRQVIGTVGRHFAGVEDLLALRLDPTALSGASVVEEDTAGSGQAFPHVYGPIPADAVLGVVQVDSPPAGAD